MAQACTCPGEQAQQGAASDRTQTSGVLWVPQPSGTTPVHLHTCHSSQHYNILGKACVRRLE